MPDFASGVLGNDTGSTLTAQLNDQPDNGTVVMNISGTFTYTPNDPEFTGTDTFTYTATDTLTGQSDTATVTITVTGTAPTIELIDVLSRPEAVAFTPDGRRAYVVNRFDNAVTVIDTATSTVIDTDPVASGVNPIFLGNGNDPVAIAISPNGTRAYVANSGTNTVTIIDTVNNKIVDANPATQAVDAIRVFNGSTPEGIVVSPGGRYVYVANRLSGVTVIDTLPTTPIIVDANPATPDVIDTITGVGANSKAVAISSDGRYLYVINATQVSIIDTVALKTVDTDPTTPGTVDPITIGTGSNLTGVAVSADGSKVYVTNAVTNTVSVIDAVSKSVVRTITVGNAPTGIAIRGNRAYVGNAIDKSITVINTADDAIIDTIAVPFRVDSVAVSPDGSLLYLTTFSNGIVTVVRLAPPAVVV